MDKKRIVLTTVYDRKVMFYLEGSEPLRVRVTGDEPRFPIGTVVVGRVKKMLDSSGACFMDIGDDKDYFLQIPGRISDLIFLDGRAHKKVSCEDLILVQVASEAVKLKSPTVTGRISVNSRHLVIEPGRGLSFSSKINTGDRKSIILPEKISTYTGKYHIIVRTEARDLKVGETLDEELADLADSYDGIMVRSQTALAYNVVYRPGSLVDLTLRDWIKYGCDEIVSDLTEYENDLKSIADTRDIPYVRYEDEYPLCKLLKLETCIDQCISRKVYLKSGAFLYIEQGETLTAIDVNSGHNIKGDKEDTTFKINLNAAEEMLKQLRLRNISGMIMVDFINMKDPSHLEELIGHTRKLLKSDDVLCRYIDMTGLGLMEITRKRVYKSFIEQWKGSN